MFFKRKPESRPPADDPTSIAAILRGRGAITLEHVAEALQKKEQQAERLIGQILVEMGAVDAHELEDALLEQKALRARTKREEVTAKVSRLERLQSRIVDGAYEVADIATAVGHVVEKKT